MNIVDRVLLLIVVCSVVGMLLFSQQTYADTLYCTSFPPTEGVLKEVLPNGLFVFVTLSGERIVYSSNQCAIGRK